MTETAVAESFNGACVAVCDICRYYAFNGDASGAYTGDGRCEHPDHPRPSEPEDGCKDFDCHLHPKRPLAR